LQEFVFISILLPDICKLLQKTAEVIVMGSALFVS